MKTLESQIEELETMRIRWLLVNLIGFILWDGFRVIDRYLIDGGLSGPMQIFTFLGWLLWVISFIQLIRLGNKVKKTKLASEILNDELVELSRLKSFQIAFGCVVIMQVVIIGISSVSFEISGALSAELSIFTAVVTAISAFIYFDKQMANG